MLNKKTALLSLALLGSAFAIVGCSSNETSTAPDPLKLLLHQMQQQALREVLESRFKRILRLRLNPSNLHLRQHNNKA